MLAWTSGVSLDVRPPERLRGMVHLPHHFDARIIARFVACQSEMQRCVPVDLPRCEQEIVASRERHHPGASLDEGERDVCLLRAGWCDQVQIQQADQDEQ